jgi:hypothetical protein
MRQVMTEMESLSIGEQVFFDLKETLAPRAQLSRLRPLRAARSGEAGYRVRGLVVPLKSARAAWRKRCPRSARGMGAAAH